MASQESLCSWKDMPNDHSRSQRINDVLIIRMEKQPVVGVTWKTDDSVDLEVLLHWVVEMI